MHECTWSVKSGRSGWYIPNCSSHQDYNAWFCRASGEIFINKVSILMFFHNIITVNIQRNNSMLYKLAIKKAKLMYIIYLKLSKKGSRKKSPRKKAPPDPKPNPTPNLTLTLYLEPFEISKMELFYENNQQLSVNYYFCEKLHIRCLKGI